MLFTLQIALCRHRFLSLGSLFCEGGGGVGKVKFNVAAFLRTFLSSANEWAEDKVHIRIGFNEKVNLKRSFNPHSFVNLYHTCFLVAFSLF